MKIPHVLTEELTRIIIRVANRAVRTATRDPATWADIQAWFTANWGWLLVAVIFAAFVTAMVWLQNGPLPGEEDEE